VTAALPGALTGLATAALLMGGPAERHAQPGAAAGVARGCLLQSGRMAGNPSFYYNHG
jgi:hypothetical protein